MNIKTQRIRFWVSLTCGTIAGSFIGLFLFPNGFSELHGMGHVGSIGISGIAALLALIGYLYGTPTPPKTTSDGISAG